MTCRNPLCLLLSGNRSGTGRRRDARYARRWAVGLDCCVLLGSRDEGRGQRGRHCATVQQQTSPDRSMSAADWGEQSALF